MPATTQQNRARLLRAASDALVDGEGRFEMQEVARRAAVSVGLAYHRFGSKAGLVAAVVEDVYRQLATAISIRDWPERDWVGREQERTRRFVWFLYETPLAALVFQGFSSEPEAVIAANEHWREVIAEGARNIAQAQRWGVIDRSRNPKLLSAQVNGGIRHAIAHALSLDPRPDPDELADELWRFIAGGLGIEARPKRPGRAKKGTR